jgi:hypothetical protein
MTDEERKNLDSRVRIAIDRASVTPREFLLKSARDKSCPRDLRARAASVAKRYLPGRAYPAASQETGRRRVKPEPPR